MTPLALTLWPSSRALRHWLAGLLAVLAASYAVAAEDEDHLFYKLQPRDTLLSLVSQYMQGPDALAQIVKLNKIFNPNIMPVGYQLKIPRNLIKFTPSSATVTRLNCRTITRLEGDTAVPVQAGDILAEGAVVRIPAGCQLAVTLEDASVLRMMSGAVIKLKTLRRNMLENSPEVRVELLDGRVEVDVPRKRQGGDAPFEIRTPTSVAGVRGTEFRVGFDAGKRNSQVEVLTGVVAALGKADTTAQRANAGQGVAIEANGKSLPVESLLPAPRYAQSAPRPESQDWQLTLQAPSQAKQIVVKSSEDASFSFIHAQELISGSELTLPDLGAKTVFQQWASVSASGLTGQTANYGFCKGYKRLDAWRCNINFNMTGLTNPRLRFEKLEEKGAALVILDQDIKITANDQLVLRGVPSGQYQWKLDYDMGANRRVTLNGQFELVAIPSEQ
jgi:hypothetical protein